MPIVHTGFQVMVALGTYLALVSLWVAWIWLRRKDVTGSRWRLRAIALGAPMGFLAIEAGWTVTEVGRQPWIIQGVLRTADAVTPMPGLIVPFLLFTLLYCFLGVIVAWLLYRQIIRSPKPVNGAGCMSPRSLVPELDLADVLAAVLALSLNAYVLFAGADFGGGVWDLLASGPRRNRQREVIAHAIGPIWEANHVWLILAIGLTFSCFPPVSTLASAPCFTSRSHSCWSASYSAGPHSPFAPTTASMTQRSVAGDEFFPAPA